VCGRHALAILPPEIPGTGTVWKFAEKLDPTGIQSQDRSVRSEVLDSLRIEFIYGLVFTF
jgi:hypothetical protein